ncbi:MAG: DUF1592 domain-containing protein [Opitutaceae bacterium]|nr:DUF1592 domain-containing protein [Opitutaceae bacterium]
MLKRPGRLRTVAVVLTITAVSACGAAEPSLEGFRRDVQPLLAKYCYDCHGDSHAKGGVTLDDPKALRDSKLWASVLKNTRTQLMPPAEEAQPTPAELARLHTWIKREAFGLDPAAPDPGRTAVRRLNRTEYRNTIRDLTGVDYDTAKEFPADDTGHGFDNIADVLTISPMLLEKYLDAAQIIVGKFVPLQSRIPAETVVAGSAFKTITIDPVVPVEPKPAAAPPGELPALTPPPAAAGAPAAPAAARAGRTAGRGPSNQPPPHARPAPVVEGTMIDLSYYTPLTVAAKHRVEHPGKYRISFEARTLERYVDNFFDLNRAHLVFKVDGQVIHAQDFQREGDKRFEFAAEREWAAGEHEFSIEVRPHLPYQTQWRNLRLRLSGVTVRGPLEEKHWVKPAGYEKVFPRDPPVAAAERRAYAREVLGEFASRAFRRPVDAGSLDRLVALAEATYSAPRATFEAGVAQAMVAVLASPRFLFRDEEVEPLRPGEKHPRVDEFTLASRLAYFLWSAPPDAELTRLAAAGQLRAQLPAQLQRMLASPRADELVRNFTGQWLEARDIATVPITPLDVFLRDHPNPEFEAARALFRRSGFGGTGGRRGNTTRTPEEEAALAQARTVFTEFNRLPKPELTEPLRRAMREETELTFAHVLREDRPLLELLQADYTFLNEDLAKHYGIAGVEGRRMRKVTLAPDSPRGGVLTQGTVLAVTSNPTRTSPVKRGVFILEAILGAPPPPPPPNIPALEDAGSPTALAKLTLRETLALHAKEPLCASCHLRMDPIGLALENFNAMGMWRDADSGHPVEPAGKLITGESFRDVRELKAVLVTKRSHDFYHCLVEKLLTYALGRGIEHYDADTVDTLVARLEAAGGRPSALLRGIVESAPFQQRRAPPGPLALNASPPAAAAP